MKSRNKFLSFEDIIDDKVSEIENLSRRQIDVSQRNENYFIAGNFLLKVSRMDHDIVKKSYWMSINFDDKSKTESEMPTKKKRRVKIEKNAHYQLKTWN